MSNALNKGAGSEASLPVTSRSRRSAPQAAFSTYSTLSRQMGATDQQGKRFGFLLLVFFVAGVSPLRRRVGGFAVAPDTPSQCTPMFLGLYCCRGFRLCGGESGALRSPPTPLRSALPCFLIFYVAGGFRACGRESGALRSPPTPLHSALSCCLTFLVAKESCISPLPSGKKVSEGCIPSLREEEKYATIRTDRSV